MADQSTLDNEVLQSEAEREGLQSWWERAHQADHAFWLSGTPGIEVWRCLGVEELVTPGASVLNIGVGLGLCTRHLAERDCLVSAMDISPTALQRVSDVARTYLADDMAALPPRAFDLALSHLVAQHMLDQDIQAQMEAVIRALKPTGVFAIQFASWLDDVEDESERSTFDAKRGGMFRTSAKMKDMAARAGGRVLSCAEHSRYPHYAASWHVIHITPA